MQINVVNVNKNVTVNNNGQAGNNNNVVVETNVVTGNVSSNDPQDILELSGQQPSAASNTQGQARQRFNPDFARMREIWQESDRHVDSFRRLVEGLLNVQIERSNEAGNPWDLNDPNAMVDIDEATRTAAQDAIGEGGPWSVDAVATRLLDFAVAISGGDPSRIDVLRSAVERGFEAAERQWGGTLPEISQQTREAVMNGFDQWQQAGNANAIELLNRNNPPATPVTLPGQI